MKKITLLPVLLCAVALSSCKLRMEKEIHPGFAVYYKKYHVDGSFALYNQKADKYILYNEHQFTQNFIPASTFKICNSLIGLEMKAVEDENSIIKWDSVVRPNPDWNHDQDMKSAFKNSTVWFYQEIARRVDILNMKYWLNKTAYGNADTSGGVDKFWLTGGLRISPNQQIDFLQRLQGNILPFSQRSMDIVKKIMIISDSNGVIVRGKAGWGTMDGTDIGWFVGYVETRDNTWFFSNCIQCKDLENKDFGIARKEITYNILRDLKIL